MSDCAMLEHNLYRLIEASPYEDRLSSAAKDALVEYLIDAGVDLCRINIDDIIVNGISILTEEEYEQYKDDFYLLVQDGDEYYAFN